MIHHEGPLYSTVQYKNDSIVSVDMDKVGVMAAYSDPLCVCKSDPGVAQRVGRGIALLFHDRGNRMG